MGIYYRKMDDKNKLVFISWKSVKNIDISLDNNDNRRLDIETNFESPTKLPKPCNGVSYLKDGKLTISFYPGITRSTSSIINKLTDLKQSKGSK